MSVHAHRTEFGGSRVVDFTDATTGPAGLPPAGSAAWRVRVGCTKSMECYAETFDRFLEQVDTSRVSALIIGYCGGGYELAGPVRRLAEAAGRFPALRALFVGDMVAEEVEISWIIQTDLTPLFEAFPGLERLEARGGCELRLEPFTAPALRALRLESGGLPAPVVRSIGAADLPRLEHLDLWLGTEDYYGDVQVADLAAILSGERLPALRHLGLENAEIQDDLAAALASAPVVARLESLSLAMGTLGDEGAEALLSGQPLTHLKRLDLHHHYLGEPVAERLRAALPGVEVDLGEAEAEGGDGEWRYVAVSE